jgi:carboxymethylenebutenolidase
MDQKIMELYDQYAHGLLDRREFLKKLTYLAGGTAAAVTLLSSLESNHAAAEIVAGEDPRLHTEYISYPGATGEVRAYLARLKGDGKLPGVVVIHENRGLNAHI